MELPIRTVDTGYGIERYAWLSQGVPSAFHAVYGPILDEIMRTTDLKIDNDLLKKAAEQSGVMVLEKGVSRREARETVAKKIGMSVEELNQKMSPIENAFAIADHTKCLAFMLAEGVVPSNVQEGYLTRLMIRRTYRLLKALAIEEKLFDVVDKQIAYWSRDFPRLKEMRDEIITILSVEREKYVQTLKRGSQLIKKVAQELKTKGIKQMPQESLVQLYDSHGLPPEVVAENIEKEGISVKVPENFYAMVASRNIQAPPTVEEKPLKGLETALSDFQPTRTLYYEDSYMKEFEAQVLKVVDGQHVVLDQTAFYPEGGGQPADHGVLKFNGAQTDVMDVQKLGKVIVHVVKGQIPRENDKVIGCIDWSRRISLMRHHTATHVIMGAARRVLGQHVWQSGAQKEVEASRLDISHFQRLTTAEIHKIEELANDAVMQTIPVETSFKSRTEAERQYGFRLYQGGAVPGKEIRVVKTGDWEVQACGGTHVKNTGEIGFIKIIHTERIQDGVERIIFSAGTQALRAVQKDEELLTRVSEKLNAPLEKLEATAERLVLECKEAQRERERLIKEIVARDTGRLLEERVEATKIEDIGSFKLVTQEFEPLDIDRMIKTASELVKKESIMVVVFYGKNQKTARIVVMAGKEAIKKGIDAREIANEAATMLGGGGSGRPDFAQGGGILVEKLAKAIKKAEETIRKQLESKK
jgi:alanyl-tRNA synthetase